MSARRTIVFDDQLWDQASERAKALGMNISSYIRFSVIVNLGEQYAKPNQLSSESFGEPHEHTA